MILMISDEFVSIAIQPIQLDWKLILSKEELANDPRIEMMLVGTKENWLSSSNLKKKTADYDQTTPLWSIFYFALK